MIDCSSISDGFLIEVEMNALILIDRFWMIWIGVWLVFDSLGLIFAQHFHDFCLILIDFHHVWLILIGTWLMFDQFWSSFKSDLYLSWTDFWLIWVDFHYIWLSLNGFDWYSFKTWVNFQIVFLILVWIGEQSLHQ